MKLAPGKRRKAPTKFRDCGHGKVLRSARWSRMRRQVLARDIGLCQECARHGVTKAGNQVDHVKKASEHQELFWRADNLQTLCESCHGRKTAAGG